MRLLWSILGWTIFGAAVSYSVAWFYAAWGTPERYKVTGNLASGDSSWTSTLHVTPPESWPAPVDDGWPALSDCAVRNRVWAVKFTAAGFTCVQVQATTELFEFETCEYRHGWPWRSTCVVGISTIDGRSCGFPVRCVPRPHPSTYFGGIDAGFGPDPYTCYCYGERDFHRLGVRPYWPGLIANTVLYGSIGSLTLGSWARSTRRRERRRRGECEVCAYEVLDLPRCPECGTSASGRPLAGQ